MQHTFSRLFIGTALALQVAAASAIPVPAGLSISGSVKLDTTNSGQASGGGSQSGTLTYRNGGSDSFATFGNNPASVSPSGLLSGGLNATGDGFGVKFVMSGLTNGALGGPLIADYALRLTNSSAALTFSVMLRGIYSNSVSASGTDAYAYSSWSVQDTSPSPTEYIFTDHKIDKFYTDPASNRNLDSASNSFWVTLLPGATMDYKALQRLEGGSASGTFGATLDTFLEIGGIQTSGGGGTRDVPEPGSLALVGAALLALARRSARKPGSRA